ncbi:hypothetical protein IU474_32605 [Nocardia otitidiscaviarum]|uniref:hypothetical protein n=1 Tax=Nocardia otitidiscaviarum TaxID=1823 RepID=UPI001893658A|nr:hypothetical protein [Nocardia otitidiscaviarum]MBF6241790.1 hypothetical protein [Nocardia otitidiscaviarum]
MKKTTRPGAASQNRGESVADAVRSAVAAAALLLTETMDDDNHSFALELDPVLRLDGERLIRSEPVPNRLRRVVSEPIVYSEGISPASRWPECFRDAVRRMDPPGGLRRQDAAVDAVIFTFTDAIETLLGTIRFAARVHTRPEGYHACMWDDFVLIPYRYAAHLSLTVDD